MNGMSDEKRATRNGSDSHEGGGPEATRHPPGDTLLLFADGLLEGDEAGCIEEHLAQCSSCALVVKRLEETVRALREAAGMRVRSDSARCPLSEELAAYADGTLRADLKTSMEAHLASCDACLQEVADLWALEGPETVDAPEASVKRVFERLKREPASAVVRWSGRTLKLIRGFGEQVAGAGAALAGGAPAPALARDSGSGAEQVLQWRDGLGMSLIGRVALAAGGPTLLGRVTHRGAPAATVSVRLRTPLASLGPESLDVSGYFGPWPLSRGSNLLVLTGVPGRRGEELAFEIEIDEEDRSS
jgi:anti-sigma factor RsiW